MPAITDLLTQATNTSRPSPTTLTALKGIGASSISCGSLTGWPTVTAVHFVLYTIDATGAKVSGTQTDWKGVVSGNTITNLTLKAGSDTAYGIGTVVEATPTAAWANDVVAWGTAHANQDGTLKATAIQSALGTSNTTNDGWFPAAQTWTYGVNNGNKEFTVTMPTDTTTTYSAGMKTKIPRSVTPPTQSMAFVAASSQYATKASPAGMTDVGAFSTEGWIYLNSYAAGGQGILSRDTGTVSGFGMVITASGQIQLFWRNATVNSNFISYQSIPLKRWVHIACVATSIATPAVTMYVNGMAIPVQTVGASATTRVQGGSLQVGAVNTTQFADAFISETRYWSVAQSQAQIQANMAINLVGNETNLVALFRGDTFNDLTANANNLTATGGATQTASYPYNPIEYGKIISSSYANPNTTLVIQTGEFNNIPNQTLGSPSYSLMETPFGLPSGLGRLGTVADIRAATINGVTTSVDIPGATYTFTTPTGGGKYKVYGASRNVNAAAAAGPGLSIIVDGVSLSGVAIYMPTGGTANNLVWIDTVNLLAGSHTIKLNVSSSSSTQFQTPQILIEQIG